MEGGNSAKNLWFIVDLRKLLDEASLQFLLQSSLPINWAWNSKNCACRKQLCLLHRLPQYWISFSIFWKQISEIWERLRLNLNNSLEKERSDFLELWLFSWKCEIDELTGICRVFCSKQLKPCKLASRRGLGDPFALKLTHQNVFRICNVENKNFEF